MPVTTSVRPSPSTSSTTSMVVSFVSRRRDADRITGTPTPTPTPTPGAFVRLTPLYGPRSNKRAGSCEGVRKRAEETVVFFRRADGDAEAAGQARPSVAVADE